MKNLTRRLILGVACLTLLGLPFLGGCGAGLNGAETQASLPGSDFELSGGVNIPVSTSANVSVAALAKPGSFYVELPAPEGAHVTVFNASNPPESGDPIGEALIDDNGTFAMQVDSSQVGSGDVLVIEAGGVTQVYEWPTLDDNATGLELPETNFDTELAEQALRAKLAASGVTFDDSSSGSPWEGVDLSGAEGDTSAASVGFDAGCVATLGDALWDGADSSEDGLSGGLALARDMLLAAYLMNGSEFDAKVQAFVAGSLAEETGDALAEDISALTGADVTIYQDGWSFAMNDTATLMTSFTDTIAAENTDTDTETAATDFCETLEDDRDHANQVVTVALDAENMEEYVSLFNSPDTFALITETLTLLNENTTATEDDAAASDFNEAVVAGVIKNLVRAKQLADISFTEQTIVDMIREAPRASAESDYSEDFYDLWSWSMAGLYADQALESDTTDFTFDTTAASAYWTMQYAGGGGDIDIDSVSMGDYDFSGAFADFYDDYEASSETYTACLSDVESCDDAYDAGEYSLLESFEGFTYDSSRVEEYSASDDSDACGDYVCDETIETPRNCPFDCGYDDDLYGSCGDGTCDTDEATWCHLDCSSSETFATSSDSTSSSSTDSTSTSSDTSSSTSYTSSSGGFGGNTYTASESGGESSDGNGRMECADDADNDGDGLIDCDDSYCTQYTNICPSSSSSSSSDNSSGSSSSSSDNSSSGSSSTDIGWLQSNTSGFGDSNNKGVVTLIQHAGTLFAGTSRVALSGAAQVYTSTDGSSWTQVSSASFSPSLSTISATAFTASAQTTGHLYLGTTNPTASGVVYESTDNGSTFTNITSSSTPYYYSYSSGNIAITAMTVASDGYLYIGTRNASGAQILRRQVSGGPWYQVYNFATDDTDVTQITSLYEYSGYIYAGTNDTAQGCHIYATADGYTWVKNSNVGDGFGSSSNTEVTAMANVGGALFVMTRNSSTGAQIRKTLNGSSWTTISTDGLGDANNTAFYGMAAGSDSKLYIASSNASGAKVYRSTDTTSFLSYTQVNATGFGDTNNKSGIPQLISYGSRMYWAGENTTTGAQVWRVTP